jgi:hypothetical protein
MTGNSTMTVATRKWLWYWHAVTLCLAATVVVVVAADSANLDTVAVTAALVVLVGGVIIRLDRSSVVVSNDCVVVRNPFRTCRIPRTENLTVEVDRTRLSLGPIRFLLAGPVRRREVRIRWDDRSVKPLVLGEVYVLGYGWLRLGTVRDRSDLDELSQQLVQVIVAESHGA